MNVRKIGYDKTKFQQIFMAFFLVKIYLLAMYNLYIQPDGKLTVKIEQNFGRF